MTRLCILSLREKAGYTGDIVIFTDGVHFFDDIPQTNLNIVHINGVEKIRQIPGFANCPEYLCAQKFRVFMTDHYNFKAYEKLIYIDYDVLVSRNISTVFDYISTSSVYFTYAAQAHWIDKYQKPYGQQSPYISSNFKLDTCINSNIFTNSTTGICSGIFGIKTDQMGALFSSWRKRIIQNVAQGIYINDQFPFNELLLEADVHGEPFPDEWIDYPLLPIIKLDDLRNLESTEKYIFHHFNPCKAETKIHYMKIFSAFGHIIYN